MGAPTPGPNSTNYCGKLDSKRHLLVDRNSVPSTVCVTGTNRHGSVVFEQLLDTLSAIFARPESPRRWSGKLHTDKADDIQQGRIFLKQHDAIARIARKCIERNNRLGRHHWGVERTHAWCAGMSKLRIRFERRIDIHLVLLSFACSIIC